MRRTPWVAAAAALLVLAAGAPAARADSIAYVKDGNVWLSTPDASRQYQVTSTGGYSDVSQADDGTMIALNDVRLHRLSRDGKVLADFDTPVSDTRPAGQRVFFGPFDPAISPDGTKLAYTWYYMTQSESNTCFPPQCVIAINEAGSAYSYADRQTGWDVPGLGRYGGWRHPVWVDNDTTMMSNPTHALARDVIVDTVSDGVMGNLVHSWFSDAVQGNPGVGGGDITRDRTKLAFVTGENDSTLTLYAVPQFPTEFKDGDAPASSLPIVCYRYSNPPGGKYAAPTFAPDGGNVAWAAGDGIYVAAVPSFAGGCTLAGATNTPPLVIPGGSEPDWGPADVPAARETVPPPGPVKPGKPARGKLSVSAKRARGGVTVRVKAPGKGRLSATVRSGRKVVGRAAKRVKKAGAATLKVRVKGHPKQVTVKVTFTPAHGAARMGSVVARLR